MTHGASNEDPMVTASSEGPVASGKKVPAGAAGAYDHIQATSPVEPPHPTTPKAGAENVAKATIADPFPEIPAAEAWKPAEAPERTTFQAMKDAINPKKAFEDVKNTWSRDGWGKAKVVVGAIGVADGLRRSINGVRGLMSSDPELKEKYGFGTLVVGIGEMAAGTALARWTGGKAGAPAVVAPGIG